MGVAPPRSNPENFHDDGSPKSAPEIVFDTVYNKIASSETLESIRAMTEPAREGLHAILPEMGLFDSNEVVSRDATAQELDVEKAMFDQYINHRKGRYQPESLEDGLHRNGDGSFYNVKDGKVDSFTTVDGKTYSDIKYGNENYIKSMTMPDGSKLSSSYARDTGLTDSTFSDGYRITHPDGSVTRPDFETAYATSKGLFTSRYGNHHTFTGLDGTHATMDTGFGASWTNTMIKTKGGFNKNLHGKISVEGSFMRSDW